MAAILLAELGVRPESFVEAAGLLRYLYEREYGIHARAEDREMERQESVLHARYVASKRHIPIDPDYTPE